MKIRLLKKVRKRFSIIHHPKGYVDNLGIFHAIEAVEFVDSKDTMFSYHYEVDKNYSFKDRIEQCRIKILKKVREEYSHRSAKAKKKRQVKVWYKK